MNKGYQITKISKIDNGSINVICEFIIFTAITGNSTTLISFIYTMWYIVIYLGKTVGNNMWCRDNVINQTVSKSLK